MFFAPKKVIGLDVGTSSIKLAEITSSRRGATLTSFAVALTPPNAISGGEILDTVSLAQAVRSLIEQIKTKRRSVVTGIWGTAVIIKKINLPRMDESLLSEQIKWEAEQYIPFDINEINLDFHVFNRSNINPDTMEVLLVAAKKDYIFRFAEVVESAEKLCAILDVSAFGLANNYFLNYGEANGEVVALLNVGASFTNFVIIDSGEVIFCRDVPVGGLNYSSEISRGLGVSIEEAEALKISASGGQATPPELLNLIESTHESVCEELRRTLDFYMATGTDASIGRVLLSGGASVTSGLKEKLGQAFQVRVEQLNPFINLSYDTSKFSPQYINQVVTLVPIAAGLALRKVGDRD